MKIAEPEAKQAIRVVIAVPSGDEVKTDFAISLVEMLRFQSVSFDSAEPVPLETKITNVRGSNLAGSRQFLVEKALADGADYLLFLDSDMSFPPNTLAQLLAQSRGHNVPIVGCTAASRVPGAVSRSNACRVDENGHYAMFDSAATGLHFIDRIGTAVLLIRTDVFEKVARPWFLFNWNEAQQRHDGEDYYFCAKVREAGLPIVVDMDLSRHIGHTGSFCYSLDEAADIDLIRSRDKTQDNTVFGSLPRNGATVKEFMR